MQTDTALLEAIGFIILMGGFMGTGFFLTILIYTLKDQIKWK